MQGISQVIRFFGTAGRYVKKIVQFLGRVAPFIPRIVKFIPYLNIFGSIINGVIGVFKGMGMSSELGVDKLVGGFTGAIAGIVEFLSFGFIEFDNFMTNIAPGIQKIFDGIKNNDSDSIKDGVIDVLTGGWEILKQAIVDFAETMFEWGKKLLPKIATYMIGVFRGVTEWLTNKFGELFGIENLATKIVTGFKTAFEELFGIVRDVAGFIKSAARKYLPDWAVKMIYGEETLSESQVRNLVSNARAQNLQYGEFDLDDQSRRNRARLALHLQNQLWDQGGFTLSDFGMDRQDIMEMSGHHLRRHLNNLEHDKNQLMKEREMLRTQQSQMQLQMMQAMMQNQSPRMTAPSTNNTTYIGPMNTNNPDSKSNLDAPRSIYQ
jgi:hypothetical protein